MLRNHSIPRHQGRSGGLSLPTTQATILRPLQTFDTNQTTAAPPMGQNRVDVPIPPPPVPEPPTEMKLHLETGPGPVNPAMEQCLRAVNNRLDAIFHQLVVMESRINQGFATLNTTMQSEHRVVLAQELQLFNDFLAGGAARAFGSSILPARAQGRLSGEPLADDRNGDEDAANDKDDEDPASSYRLSMPPGVDPVYTVTHCTRMRQHFQSIQQMHDQWTGQGEFQGEPVVGGFAELEKVRAATWRTGYKSSEVQRFSKIKRIMNALFEQAKHRPLKSVFQEFEQLWSATRNVTRMVESLQNCGYIKKDSRPNKRQKRSTALEPIM